MMKNKNMNRNIDDDDDDEIVAVVQAKPVRVVEVAATTRQALSPYLPPPLVKAMNTADPMLEPYVGPEASMTLLGTLLLSFFVYQVIKVVAVGTGSTRVGKSAIVADERDDEHVLSQRLAEQAFTQSILLLGASNAGKTRLFYYLCYGRSKGIGTITSLRANVGFRTFSEENGNTMNGHSSSNPPNGSNVVRFMDFPAHLPMQNSSQIMEVLRKRVILVLDATQPVATAADMLLQLISLSYSTPELKQQQPLSILICVNKSDLQGSKNWKRIKIRLRTELDRLLKVEAVEWYGSDKWVWEDVTAANFYFLSTSVESGVGLDALTAFCCDGSVPDQTGGRSKQISK